MKNSKPSKPKNEFIRLMRAFGYSLEGLKVAFWQPAFRTEFLAALLFIPAAFFIGQTAIEVALLVSSVLLVLIVETLNTAVEKTIDRISEDWHMLSKDAKDLGSTAVLLSLINAAIVWLIILFW